MADKLDVQSRVLDNLQCPHANASHVVDEPLRYAAGSAEQNPCETERQT